MELQESSINNSANLAAGCSWFAVQVKATHEKRIASMLSYKHYECFLPQYTHHRRWSDRIKQVELPLFPGYIFCRFAPGTSARVEILKTPSVTRIVGVGYIPIPVDEQEIAAIQRVVQSGFGISPHPFLQVGLRVRINGGSLNGMEGLIADIRRLSRITGPDVPHGVFFCWSCPGSKAAFCRGWIEFKSN